MYATPIWKRPGCRKVDRAFFCVGQFSSSSGSEIRSNLSAFQAAHRADELRFYIGQPHVVCPLLGADHGRMAAFEIPHDTMIRVYPASRISPKVIFWPWLTIQHPSPGHRRAGRVLDLDPVRRPAGAIWPVPTLRDQPFKPHVAGGAEQVRADLALLEGCDENPIGAARQQPREVGLAHRQRQARSRHPPRPAGRRRRAGLRRLACGCAERRSRRCRRRRAPRPRRRGRTAWSGSGSAASTIHG